MNFPSRSQLQQGFTLIETLFAILIFSAALVSLMVIAGRGISATASARSQITAYYLAQEGLEVARNVRDSNFLDGSPWDTGLGQGTACTETDPCNVAYGTIGTSTAPGLVNCMNQNEHCEVWQLNGAYVDKGEPNAEMSPYSRTVIAYPGTPNPDGTISEYRIVATVTWTFKTIPRSVTLETLLEHWQ